MTKLRTLYFLLLLIVTLFSSCTPDAKDILEKSINKCQSINNGYYEFNHLIRYMYGDSVTQSYKCYFKKLPDDSLFSSAFHLQQYYNGNYSQDVLYTGNELINYWLYDSVGEIMSNKLWAQDIKFRGQKFSYFSPFFNKQSYPLPTESDFANNDKTIKFIGEEPLVGSPCYHISMSSIPKSDSTEVHRTIKTENNYWIHKTELIPLKYTITYTIVEYEDTLYQHEENTLSKYELNNLNNDSSLTLSSIPPYVKIKDFKPYNSPELLPDGSTAPDWSFASLKGDSISLTDLKGKVVLIDFFYKSCHPCMLALPGLQNLHINYYDRGLRVIGINPFDTKEDDDIENYLLKRGITYPILLTDRTIINNYHIYGYPTIYLIDKQGKILLSKVGYKEGNEDAIEKIIIDHL